MQPSGESLVSKMEKKVDYVSMVREKVWAKLQKSSRNEKGPNNFAICFHEFFCSFDQILVFGWETGH